MAGPDYVAASASLLHVLVGLPSTSSPPNPPLGPSKVPTHVETPVCGPVRSARSSIRDVAKLILGLIGANDTVGGRVQFMSREESPWDKRTQAGVAGTAARRVGASVRWQAQGSSDWRQGRPLFRPPLR